MTPDLTTPLSDLTAEERERIDAAAAAVVIEISFAVPRGTDLSTHSLPLAVTRFRDVMASVHRAVIERAVRQLQAQQGQTCETCRFAMKVNDEVTGTAVIDADEEWQKVELIGRRQCFILGKHVPLTVNGAPFGCRAWQPKDGETR